MKKIVSILLALTMLLSLVPSMVFAAEEFKDVDGTEYYADEAYALSEMKIIEGYPDNTFGADKPIKRSEMAVIVCKLIEKAQEAEAAKGKTDFDDVDAEHWASGYINIASEEDIISGYGDGTFCPDKDVKYEEALKMIVCALGYGEDIEIDPDDWSAGYLDMADKKGISDGLKGSKGNAATRGDIAVMSYNALAAELAAPTASVEAGTYEKTQKVTLTTATEDAEIYYTTDGTTPTAGSSKYTKEISIDKTTTLKAIAVKNGVLLSDVMSVEYTFANADDTTEVPKMTGGSRKNNKSTYTVEFDLNYEGATGTPESQIIANGEKVSEPAEPTREGYNFIGWFSDEECEIAFGFNTSITSSITLYAKWEELVDSMNLYSSKSSVLIGETEKTYIYLETEIEADFIDLYDVKDDTESVISMYDDGDFVNHGDDMAGDGIYSAYISDLSVDDIEITFVAIYNNSKSNEVKVQYYTVISDEENEIMVTVDNKIDEILSSDDFTEKTIEEKEELVQDTLNAFVETGEISEGSIFYSENDELFSFQYSNGVLGGVMIGEFEDDMDRTSRNSQTNEISLSTIEMDALNTLTIDNSDALDEVEEYPLGNALILNSFPSFETEASAIAWRTNFYNDARDEWNSKGLNTTVDTNVTVSDYLNLAEYEVVCISTHGSRYSWNDGSHTVSAICLSEQQTKAKNKEYSSFLKNKEIVKVNGCYWILPTFFENEYSSGDLEDTFVFVQCCMSMGTGAGSNSNNYDYTMPNSFLNSSAKTYVGYHNSVFSEYGRDFMKTYIDNLISGETSGSAFSNAISTHGVNHEAWFNNKYSYTLKDYYEIYKDNPETFVPNVHIAYPVHNGDADATLVEIGLKNGDFEKFNIFTTSPRYWNKVGDVRTLTQLGDVKPLSGNGRMAVISTGIGANSTNVIGGGTEGSIISQTFVLPNDATEIAFDYNLISEEPMEYVGSKYNDAFAVNILCENENVYNNIYESINSSTWIEVSDIDFSGGDKTVYQTNWNSAKIDISAYAGKVITLRFIIYDVGDSEYDSACVIDNVTIK